MHAYYKLLRAQFKKIALFTIWGHGRAAAPPFSLSAPGDGRGDDGRPPPRAREKEGKGGAIALKPSPKWVAVAKYP